MVCDDNEVTPAATDALVSLTPEQLSLQGWLKIDKLSDASIASFLAARSKLY